MAKCIVCEKKIPKENKKVCPDCGALLQKGPVNILAPGMKKKSNAYLFCMENVVFFRTYNATANMFGAVGAAIAAANAKNGLYNASDIESIEYPVVVKKLSKTAMSITFKDGNVVSVGSMGNKKKSQAIFEKLTEAYLKKAE